MFSLFFHNLHLMGIVQHLLLNCGPKRKSIKNKITNKSVIKLTVSLIHTMLINVKLLNVFETNSFLYTFFFFYLYLQYGRTDKELKLSDHIFFV